MRDSDGGSGARAGNCGPGKGTKWRRGKMTWPAVMSIMLATSNHADAWQCALPGPGVLRPPGVGSLLPARMEAKSLWLMSHRHYPSPLLLRQKGSHYFASDGFFLARSNTRRAAGVIIRANEDTGEGKQDELTAFKQGDGSSRMLQSLPLPPLPYPFNSTLASLLSNTPSKWRAKVPKDWSLEADVLPPPSSTSTTSPSAQQWSSPSSKSSIGRSRLQHTISKNTKRIEVKSSEQLQTLLEQAVSVYKMDLRGISLPQRQDSKGRLLDPTQFQPTLEQLQHPVIAALQERRRAGSKPGKRDDGYKIALAIEGGGLRGCVSAGMASSLAHLGLEDSFDMVLGSSAGSIIGAYFVGRSTPQTTYRFFCNHLTTSKDHLNGANWLDISRLVDLFRPTASRTDNRAVMLLDYPMDDIMQRLCPLDWETFEKNDKVQPMQVIAAGLLTEGAVSLSSAEGSFRDLPSLCNCIKSSCMLPGIAGTQPKWHTASSAPQLRERFRGSSEDQGRRAEGKEPMVDALVYEPIPYRTALAQGATHVLVLRSYPDGTFLPKRCHRVCMCVCLCVYLNSTSSQPL